MKRIAFLAIVLSLAIGVGLKGAVARPAQTGDLLRLLPDSSGVVIVDLQKVTSSSLWSTLSTQNKMKGAIDKAQSGIAELGLKLSDIHTVALVIPPSGVDNFTAAVSGTFDQNILLTRLRANEKVKLNSETYKNIEVFKAASSTDSKGKRNMAFAFYDAGTVVIGTDAGVRASIDARAGDRPSISQNEKLSAAMSQNPLAAIRFAMSVTPAMTNSLKVSNAPLPDFSTINLIFGTVDVTTGLDINATLRSDTAAHATAITDQLNGLLGMAKGLLGASNDPKMSSFATALNTVKISGADVDVKVSGSLPGEIFAQVIQ